jgi:hypothetical protein
MVSDGLHGKSHESEVGSQRCFEVASRLLGGAHRHAATCLHWRTDNAILFEFFIPSNCEVSAPCRENF